MIDPAWLGLVWKGIAVAIVGVLCMGIGWFVFRGPGTPATPPAIDKQVAVNAAPKPPASDRPRATAPTSGVGVGENAPSRPSAPPPKPEPPKPEPPKPLPALVLTFEKDVLPILETKCVSCHGERKKSGKLDVRTLAALRKGGSSGPSIVPGEPDRSPFWDEVAGDRMPPANKNRLTAAEKNTLRNWILSGAK